MKKKSCIQTAWEEAIANWAKDEEFIREIRHTHRQPGEYCIKGDRLEYRSLPELEQEGKSIRKHQSLFGQNVTVRSQRVIR